jgi:ketosteroid isomerase-like protein
MRRLVQPMRLIPVILFLLATVLSGQAPPTPAPSAEEAIRQADAAWMKAIVSKSVEHTVEMYDAEVLTAGSAMPPARGLAGIRAMWTQLFAQPDFVLTWKTDKVQIVDSGLMAYSTATWRGAEPKSGGPALVVWRKQRDGSWKVLIDSAWFWGAPD